MEEFDITEFAKMFDAALASDNPSVKKALRNFMMVTAIVHAQEQDADEREMGPLETLVKKVTDLERMVYHELKTNQYRYKDYKDYYGNNPSWVYSPTTSTTSSNTSTWVDDSIHLNDLLKDLKFK